MANQWFRMYAEFASDPKVQMLSETDQRRYIMVLCIRCNGDVTLQDEEVAFQLRICNEEWLKTKGVLVSKNLIGEDNKPTAWNKRQFASDSSAARVSKHRANKKQACNVTLTPQNRTEQNRTEESISLPEQAKPKAKKATSFPADFSPNETCLKLASELGVDPDEEFLKFRDHHLMKGTVGKDWQAGFRTWLNNSVKFGSPAKKKPEANAVPDFMRGAL